MAQSHPLGVRELKPSNPGNANQEPKQSHPLGVRELKPECPEKKLATVESHPLGVRELKRNGF